MTNEITSRKIGLIYTVIWVLVVVLCMLHKITQFSGEFSYELFLRAFVRAVDDLWPLFLVFLVNNFVLIPCVLHKKGLTPYVISAICLIAIVGVWQYIDHVNFEPPRFNDFYPQAGDHFEPPPPPPHRHGHKYIHIPVVNDILYSTLVVVINLAFSLAYNFVRVNLEKERLQAINLSSQLEHLKMQINPHFYMNMLNNIHGLIDINQERAKDMVFDMSQLMQYMLYDSGHEWIPLSSELKFLQDYLHVMRERYPASKVEIRAEFPDQMAAERVRVAPLLFLVFIENAFKHGIDYRHKSFIHIRMALDGDRINFICENSRQTPETTKTSRGGIGLENIRKRLNLIYGDKASLKIDETSSIYSVNLTLVTHETQDNHH